MIPHGPLAPFAIALWLMAGVAVLGIGAYAIRRWWRDGGRQYRRTRLEAALDTRPVTRDDLVIHPQLERPDCTWCDPRGRFLAPGEGCRCDDDCGADCCLYDLREVL